MNVITNNQVVVPSNDGTVMNDQVVVNNENANYYDDYIDSMPNEVGNYNREDYIDYDDNGNQITKTTAAPIVDLGKQFDNEVIPTATTIATTTDVTTIIQHQLSKKNQQSIRNSQTKT
jgi:hypothetical protein